MVSFRGGGLKMEDNKVLTESVQSTPKFSAFITNLGKYNEGELIGEWVDFPIDEDDFDDVLARIGVSNEPDETGTYYEEWFVTDYECTLNGFDWQEFGEYPSYETLQEFGELVDSIDDVTAVDNAYEVTGDLQEAIDGIETGDIIFYDGISNESDLGWTIINEIYGDDIPEDLLERYFDFDMFGRDLSFDEYEGDDGEYVSAGEYWCGDENASDYDIGVSCVEQLGGTEGISNPDNYFDYEAFGRDLTFEGFTFTSDGCIEYR